MTTSHRHDVRLHGHRIGFVKPLLSGQVEIFAIDKSGEPEYRGKAETALEGRQFLEALGQVHSQSSFASGDRGEGGSK